MMRFEPRNSLATEASQPGKAPGFIVTLIGKLSAFAGRVVDDGLDAAEFEYSGGEEHAIGGGFPPGDALRQ